jgi:hypothetical protein
MRCRRRLSNGICYLPPRLVAAPTAYREMRGTLPTCITTISESMSRALKLLNLPEAVDNSANGTERSGELRHLRTSVRFDCLQDRPPSGELPINCLLFLI